MEQGLHDRKPAWQWFDDGMSSRMQFGGGWRMQYNMFQAVGDGVTDEMRRAGPGAARVHGRAKRLGGHAGWGASGGGFSCLCRRAVHACATALLDNPAAPASARSSAPTSPRPAAGRLTNQAPQLSQTPATSPLQAWYWANPTTAAPAASCPSASAATRPQTTLCYSRWVEHVQKC